MGQILFHLIRFELKCLFPHSLFWTAISPYLESESPSYVGWNITSTPPQLTTSDIRLD